MIFNDKGHTRVRGCVSRANNAHNILIYSTGITGHNITGRFVGGSNNGVGRVFASVHPGPAASGISSYTRLVHGYGTSFTITLNKNSPVSYYGTTTTVTEKDNGVTRCRANNEPIGTTRTVPVVTFPAADKATDRIAGVSILASATGKLGTPVGSPTVCPGVTVVSPRLALSIPPTIATSAKLSILDRTVRDC